MIKLLDGFKPLYIQYSSETKFKSQVFIKEYICRGKSEETPQGKTLFVTNVPPYADKASLNRVFSVAGEVKDVLLSLTDKPEAEMPTKDTVSKFFKQIDSTRNRFKNAFIIYKSAKGLESALKLSELPPLSQESANERLLVGVEKWKREYFEPFENIQNLQAEIDLFMQSYDLGETEKNQLENEGVVDDEGWTVVTKSGKHSGFQQKESVINKLEQKLAKGKQNKELQNFYTFQIRESKMKHIAGLRKRFDEDKKKIEEMKNKRRFKPF